LPSFVCALANTRRRDPPAESRRGGPWTQRFAGSEPANPWHAWTAQAALGGVRAGQARRRARYLFQGSAARICLIHGCLKAEREDLMPQQLKVLATLMKEIADG